MLSHPPQITASAETSLESGLFPGASLPSGDCSGGTRPEAVFSLLYKPEGSGLALSRF